MSRSLANGFGNSGNYKSNLKDSNINTNNGVANNSNNGNNGNNRTIDQLDSLTNTNFAPRSSSTIRPNNMTSLFRP